MRVNRLDVRAMPIKSQSKRKIKGETRPSKTREEASHESICFLRSLFLLFSTVFVLSLPVIVSYLAEDVNVSCSFLLPLFVWGGATLVSLLLMRGIRFNGDTTLFWCTSLLLGLGTAVQYRLGTWATEWHLVYTYLPYFVGIVGALCAILCLDAKRIEQLLPKMKWIFWLLAIVPLVALLAFGRRYRGGIFLPGNINPSELTKVFLVLFTAGWLPKHLEGLSRAYYGLSLPPMKTLISLGIGWGIPLAIVVLVGDFGMILILSLTLMILLATATRRWGWFFVGTLMTAFAGFVVQFLSAHTRTRFMIWLDPFKDPDGKGYQIGQSLCAQYAGKLFGTGVGNGHPEYVPIVESDFVYAVLAEEWGLVGCGLLLMLYMLWLQRIASPKCTSVVNQMLAWSIAALLGTQVFLNIAGITKALPMTGITLPFFSLGGSSLIAVLFLLGIALANTKTKSDSA